MNWKRLANPLRNGKVIAALAVIVAAYAAEFGWDISETTLSTVIAFAAGIILGQGRKLLANPGPPAVVTHLIRPGNGANGN